MKKVKLGLFFEKSHDRLPTELIFIDMLQKHFDCMIFESEYLDDQGYIQEFINHNDILLPHLFSLRAASKSKKWGDYLHYSENYKRLIMRGMRVVEILQMTSKPICCFNLRSDWYPESKAFWEIIPPKAYILGGIQKGYLNPSPKHEFFFDQMEINIDLGNHYFGDDQIIPLRHFLSDQEIQAKPMNKKYDLSVLGVFYARRNRIYEKAKELPIKLYNPWLLHRLRKMLNRYHKRYYWSNELLNHLFNRALRQSRISYTDGSELDMFIRKYLEIPASHTLLLCNPLAQMQDYGFVENVHYVRCDESHLQDQLQWLLNDTQKRSEIIQSSFELVQKLYCYDQVLRQMQILFESLKVGIFKGCYYRGGELIFKHLQG